MRTDPAIPSTSAKKERRVKNPGNSIQ